MSSRALALLSVAALMGCGTSPSPSNDAGPAPDVAVVTDRAAPADVPDARDVPAPLDAPPDPCEGLSGVCHDVDPGSGPLHDCHEGAHDRNATWCAANAARCRQLCTEARDASAPTDAAADVATDAPAHAHDASAAADAHQH
ncbi:MAG: hypothetical protein U0325_14650 [Polyangiales bacterium]